MIKYEMPLRGGIIGMRGAKTLLIQIRYLLTKQQKREVVWIILITLIGAVAELLGISSLLPFIQVVTSPDTLLKNKYLKGIFATLQVRETYQLVLVMSVMLIMIYIVKNVYLYWMYKKQYQFAAAMQRDLSVKMMKSYINRDYMFHVNTNSSVLLRGVVGDVTDVFRLMSQGFRLAAEGMTVILFGVYLLILEPVLAMVVIVFAGICAVWFFASFKNKIKMAGKEANDSNACASRAALQTFNGIKEIKIAQREIFFEDEFEKHISKKAEAERKREVYDKVPAYAFEVVSVASILGAVSILLLFGANMEMLIPKLGVFAVAAFRMLPAASRISVCINVLVYYRPALENTYSHIKEINEYEENNTEVYIEKDSTGNRKKFEKDIEVENVSWSYTGNEYVLRDVSFKVEKGQSVAFIGTSGAGKTTMADIILGLLRPQKGTVKVDGMPIYDNMGIWSQMIGYVPQTIYLTDDTVRNNIAFGIPSDQIDNDRVWDALEKSQMKEYVQALEQGLDTIVGEQGVRFSGGQRQRIAIARALYNDPDILVLDEATSALDNDTEQAIMQAIEKLQGVKTLIIVAHRLGTISKCDVIYEIGRGNVTVRNKAKIMGT